MLFIPSALRAILKHLHDKGFTSLVVGGAVRDALLGLPCHDLDVEVFGISSLETLKTHLASFGKIEEVGKHFQVLKLRREGFEFDFSLPRQDVKIGEGHRGFKSTLLLPNATFEQAAARRDFTVNAMGFDPLTNTLFDPFNGAKDLAEKRLRHIGPAFTEDPLRVYRAMQLAARFELTIDQETLALCRSMPLQELPEERCFEEFKKLLLKAAKPSLGLSLLESLGILPFFPELKAIQGVPQNPKWHPEGDVWAHTLMVVDEMAKRRTGSPEKDLEFMFGALCHDLGKALCTKLINGEWKSFGHEEKGVVPATRFMKRLTLNKTLIKAVCMFVKEHGHPLNLYLNNQYHPVSAGAIHRLALRSNLKDLLILATADSCGRTTQDALSGYVPHIDWLREKATQLGILEKPLSPLLTGTDLKQLGFHEGPHLGLALKTAFEAQLDGAFSTPEESKAWAKDNLF